jgi:hypothetical protein
MNPTKCLIVTCGFFGDIIFASSLAEKLKGKYDQIDYLIGFPQVQRLLLNNPFINNVYVSQSPNPHPINNSVNPQLYTEVIKLHPLNYLVTPCEEYQQYVGVTNPSSEYKVYTQPEYDEIAKQLVEDLRTQHQKPVLGVMSNWEPKTYIFNRKQYMQGIDVPNLGYGGKHRNIGYIIGELEKHFTLYPLGVGALTQQHTISLPDEDPKSILFEASIMKYCDAFIGTDGGLATIAAGVGTKTIITGDFNLQLYGWNGSVKKIKNPRLGPKEYFGDHHIVLDPFLTDGEIIQQLKTIIK